MRRWVFDASPLIALGKTGLLGLPVDLGIEGVLPQAVAAEIAAGDDTDAARLWHQAGPPFPIVAVPVVPVVAAWGLGDGESEAISYALTHPGVEAMLDERSGRACATTLGVRPRGTLGLLVLAKRKGVVAEVRPHVEALLAAGYRLGAPLIEMVLADVGEDTGRQSGRHRAVVRRERSFGGWCMSSAESDRSRLSARNRYLPGCPGRGQRVDGKRPLELATGTCS
jgi:predicted nucleic acid-binding protein